ncbi:MAG TPA: NAD(P)H-hydrate dehydratase [Oculatellaceae cyanobacterium]|jgi:hydroxyethylthiazole kinase-like uncharacterized protein yjeF
MKLIPNLSEIDRQAIQQGVAAQVLMENAGRAVAEAILRYGGKCSQGVILCGPGNNGGDGFVCARYLHQAGIPKLTVVHTSGQYRNEALRNYERLMQLPVEVVDARSQLEIALNRIRQSDFMVDALFGSGLSRSLEGLEKQLIDTANEATESLTWAIDLPSGIDGATGRIMGAAIRANFTVTLAAAKPGLYLQPGKMHAGEVQLVDIGIPQDLIEADESRIFLITPALAKSWLPARRPDSHKYDYGHVLIVAGNNQMPGAAVLCAEAAMNAGAGLVTLAAPESVFRQISLIPEVLRVPFPETACFTETTCSESILPLLETGKYSTVLIGPGLGQNPDTVSAVLALLKHLQGMAIPVVVDADALNALATHPMALNDRFILTPHMGEAARLLQSDSATLRANPLAAVQKLRERYQAQVVLKSASTVVADAEGMLWISPRGNPGMATAGSGDVLAGILSAQVAQVHACTQHLGHSVPLAVYLHGMAGDEAAANITPYAMRASDITYHLPDAFRKLLNHSEPDA